MAPILPIFGLSMPAPRLPGRTAAGAARTPFIRPTHRPHLNVRRRCASRNTPGARSPMGRRLHIGRYSLPLASKGTGRRRPCLSDQGLRPPGLSVGGRPRKFTTSRLAPRAALAGSLSFPPLETLPKVRAELEMAGREAVLGDAWLTRSSAVPEIHLGHGR
jgi:hypothetical protein